MHTDYESRIRRYPELLVRVGPKLMYYLNNYNTYRCMVMLCSLQHTLIVMLLNLWPLPNVLSSSLLFSLPLHSIFTLVYFWSFSFPFFFFITTEPSSTSSKANVVLPIMLYLHCCLSLVLSLSIFSFHSYRTITNIR